MGTTAWSWLVLTLVCCFFVPKATPQIMIMEDPHGILTIDGPGLVLVPTRIGCRSVVRCEGSGTDIFWKRFTRRDVLETEGNRLITLDRDDPDMDGEYSLTGHLILDPVMSTDSGRFTCTINSDSFPITLTAQLTVNPEAAELSVNHYNISGIVSGDTLPVLCAVESCIPNVTVEFLSEDGTVLGSDILEDPLEGVVQFNPLVTEDLAGEYSCRVRGSFMGDFVFIERFNITGVPLPPPTTVTMSGGGSNPGGGGSRGGGTALHTATITALAVTLLLALLLA